MDPHTFLTDPDLAVFSNADPDPATVLSAFFLLLFFHFSLLDPDPQGKLNADFEFTALVNRYRTGSYLNALVFIRT